MIKAVAPSPRSAGNGEATLEKLLSRSGVNIMTLLVIIFSVGMFYAQNNSNQDRNEERFKSFATQREVQAVQMTKLEEVQSKTLVQLSALTERLNAQTDVIKDIRDILRTPPPSRSR